MWEGEADILWWSVVQWGKTMADMWWVSHLKMAEPVLHPLSFSSSLTSPVSSMWTWHSLDNKCLLWSSAMLHFHFGYPEIGDHHGVNAILWLPWDWWPWYPVSMPLCVSLLVKIVWLCLPSWMYLDTLYRCCITTWTIFPTSFSHVHTIHSSWNASMLTNRGDKGWGCRSKNSIVNTFNNNERWSENGALAVTLKMVTVRSCTELVLSKIAVTYQFGMIEYPIDFVLESAVFGYESLLLVCSSVNV